MSKAPNTTYAFTGYIDAIKWLREQTGFGLREAKEAVDNNLTRYDVDFDRNRPVLTNALERFVGTLLSERKNKLGEVFGLAARLRDTFDFTPTQLEALFDTLEKLGVSLPDAEAINKVYTSLFADVENHEREQREFFEREEHASSRYGYEEYYGPDYSEFDDVPF